MPSVQIQLDHMVSGAPVLVASFDSFNHLLIQYHIFQVHVLSRHVCMLPKMFDLPLHAYTTIVQMTTTTTPARRQQ